MRQILDKLCAGPQSDPMMTPVLQVAAGGAIGASARYFTSNAATRLLGTSFPAGTMVVNVVGSVLMGLLVVALARKDAAGLAPLLMTGLLGGFTTFSAFSLDAVNLIERGQFFAASGYVIGSVLISITGLMAGMYLSRMVLS